jgi:hypothetical protein
MFSKLFITTAVIGLGISTSLAAENVPITGIVQSKCSIFTDTQGVYGNPMPYKLSTTPADGGVLPIIRYDVAAPDYYKARIMHPNGFSSSPDLSDAVAWTGSTSVSEVTDPLMSDYETSKIEYDNTTEFDLTVAGTVWFEVASTVEYGYNKAFPAGTYTSLVVAECIAK